MQRAGNSGHPCTPVTAWPRDAEAVQGSKRQKENWHARCRMQRNRKRAGGAANAKGSVVECNGVERFGRATVFVTFTRGEMDSPLTRRPSRGRIHPVEGAASPVAERPHGQGETRRSVRRRERRQKRHGEQIFGGEGSGTGSSKRTRWQKKTQEAWGEGVNAEGGNTRPLWGGGPPPTITTTPHRAAPHVPHRADGGITVLPSMSAEGT